MRLRSIQRYRAGRKGRGRGWDHQRYPDDVFAQQTLISLYGSARAGSGRSLSPAAGEALTGEPYGGSTAARVREEGGRATAIP